MSRSVAIITARGGSKRIPRKNIRDFLGKPIITYSIEAALESECFDEVMVSTDDDEIANIARKCGAKVPFLRSAETANDFASTIDVLVEVLSEYQKQAELFEYACCIYPTAPLVTPKRLKFGHELLLETGADSALPIVRFSYPIMRGLKVEKGRLSMIWPEFLDSRSQDLMPAYHDSGQFYWIRVARFLETRNIFADYTVPIELSESEVQDIDTEEDWMIAEMKYRMLFRPGK